MLAFVSVMSHKNWSKEAMTRRMHHHVWRLVLEHGVKAFGTEPILVREPELYSHRTSAVRAGHMLQAKGRCDGFEVRRCNLVHRLDHLLESDAEFTSPDGSTSST